MTAEKKLLQLTANTIKYLKVSEDELQYCNRVCIRLKNMTDSGITNAKHLRNEERAKKKLAFKAKEVYVVRKCLDSLVHELNHGHGHNYTEEEIMNMEISDSDDEAFEDEKKELLNQLPSVKKQWEEAKSERFVCRDTWREIKEARAANPALKKDDEENEKFKAAIENFRSAQEKESAALAAYESLVDKLGALAEKEEKEKEMLLRLIVKTNKYLKVSEDELKYCNRVCIRLKNMTDSGITNANHLRNEERAKEKLAFKAKEVYVVKEALDSLVDELNDGHCCNYTIEDIMNLDISDSDDDDEAFEDEKKELLNQLPSIKKQWEDAVSERFVCRDTWREIKEAREENPALKKDDEENEKFKAAIENFRSAQEKESAALAAYESLVDKLGVLYDNQDDTISFSDDDEIHYGDGESES